MSYIVRRIVLAVIGMVITLTWWTITGRGSGGSGSAPKAEHIPKVLWSGIEGPLGVEVNLAGAGKVEIDFEEMKEHGERKHLHTAETLTPGPHRFDIRVPKDVGASIEVTMDHPKTGDRMVYALYGGDTKVYQFDETAPPDFKPDSPWQEGFELYDCATCDRERIEAILSAHPELRKW
jgi:hypothetical protein